MSALGILIVGHGSRIVDSNIEFEVVVEQIQQAHPDARVTQGYVELAEPSLDVALQEILPQVDRLVVLPLFLFAAGHVKNDIPMAVARYREEFPSVSIYSAPPLGVHPFMTQALKHRITETCEFDEDERANTAIVVVGRGASDPDANGDFCKQVRLLFEGSGYSGTYPAFIGITDPRVEESLNAVARLRPKHLVIAP